MKKLVLSVFFALLAAMTACSSSDSAEEEEDLVIVVECDTSVVDTVFTDTLLTDSLPNDTAIADTSVLDSSLVDSLAVDSTLLDSAQDLSPKSMVLVAGAQLTLGMNDSLVPANEQPSMRVKLDYDFLMGVHEVTCGEYAELVEQSALKKFGDCENPNLPLVNVTFYDAVLFANAMSVSHKRDTVYTYISASFSADNHCTNLDGLAFHPEVEGYRLPTEAEWVLAASGDWDPEASWNASNSNYVAHEVCTSGDAGGRASLSGKKDSVLCDMAGNVMEWVNDWLGYFHDTTVTNYVGAPDGGQHGERVVKGGSFRTDPLSIKRYRRGDVYKVTSSAKEEYVGFRLAYGAIPGAVWMASNGSANKSQMTILANSAKVKSITGSYRTKLAFRNDLTGNLAFVDYSAVALSVVEIPDTMEVYHPEISPDGNRVAFSTGLEGISGKSSVYVRDLNAEGSGLVKLEVENASIPRWRVTPSGDTVIVYVTSSANNRDEVVFRGASTWQVKFEGGRFGVPQRLFDGAYHGGVNFNGSLGGVDLAVTGARLLRARIADSAAVRDTLWYAGEQACNVSLSRDASHRTLFLDFGGRTGRKFAGKSYGSHEMLLVADRNGTLVQAVPSPRGRSFDHTEWVVGDSANLVVATLANIDGVHGRVVLVDLSDSTVMPLVDGVELWHPSLWVKGSNKMVLQNEWNLDSACVYYVDVSNPLLSFKMNAFWSEYDSLEVVAVGSSRMSMAFAPSALSYGRSYNMAAIPSDMDVSLYVLENYVFRHAKSLKAVIVGIDPDLWNDAENVKVAENLLAIPGYFYDRDHDFWEEKDLPELKKISERILSEQEVFDGNHLNRGWVNILDQNSWTTGGFNQVDILGDSTWCDSTDRIERALAELEKILQMAKERNVLVLGVVFPQSPYYATTGSFGRHAIRRSCAEQALSKVDSMQLAYDNFVFMDENKMGAHDYADSLAYDYDHLNGFGALRLTAKIDSVLLHY